MGAFILAVISDGTITLEEIMTPFLGWDMDVEGSRINYYDTDEAMHESFKNLITLKTGEKVNSAKIVDIKYETWLSHAVLTPDGRWHEQFDISHLEGKKHFMYYYEDFETWCEKYKERFIDTANRDWDITIVDCHV